MCGKIVKKCSYFGPINSKQINALLMTLRDYDVNDTATIGNGNVKQMFKLKDVMQYVNGIYDQSSILEDICRYIVESSNQNSLEINI